MKTNLALCLLFPAAVIVGGCAGEYNISTANGTGLPLPLSIHFKVPLPSPIQALLWASVDAGFTTADNRASRSRQMVEV
jgi:hypothetical protein